jgi:spermidine/putrescine transport system ATP-binding protein
VSLTAKAFPCGFNSCEGHVILFPTTMSGWYEPPGLGVGGNTNFSLVSCVSAFMTNLIVMWQQICLTARQKFSARLASTLCYISITVQPPGVREPLSAPGASTAKRDGLAIEAHSLIRRFGTIEALANVSLSVRQGEFFSLLGPSGCGKTTLLRVVAGLDSPDAGSLKIGGKDAAELPAHKRPVNTVFQSYALFPHMTVWDNVTFGLRMTRVPAAEIAARVERVMALVQISELNERRPAQLSGGQKQRVALARALVNEPEVLLLDEPLGALDLKLRKQLQVELHQLQRRLGITFIYVTHDQDEALVMSDRIAIMNAGRIEQMDQAEDLYERPRTRFVAQFLGSCNLLEAQVESVNGNEVIARTEIGPLRVTLPFSRPSATLSPSEGERDRVRGKHDSLHAGDKITLAIRPEKISLAKPGNPQTSNCLSARIENLVYRGAENQCRLRANEYSFDAVLLNARAGHQGFHIGDTVVCHLPEQALIVLDD